MSKNLKGKIVSDVSAIGMVLDCGSLAECGFENEISPYFESVIIERMRAVSDGTEKLFSNKEVFNEIEIILKGKRESKVEKSKRISALEEIDSLEKFNLAVSKAEKEIERGEFFTHEEVMNEVKNLIEQLKKRRNLSNKKRNEFSFA